MPSLELVVKPENRKQKMYVLLGNRRCMFKFILGEEDLKHRFPIPWVNALISRLLE